MVVFTQVVSLDLEAKLRLLQELSDEEPGVRSVLVSSYDSSSSAASSDSVKVPEILESQATLGFLEFTPSAVNTIWKIYSDAVVRAESDPEHVAEPSFLAVIRQHIRNGWDACDVGDDWWGAMDSMGVNKDLQTRMMKPQYEEIRYHHTAMEWILDTVRNRFS